MVCLNRGRRASAAPRLGRDKDRANGGWGVWFLRLFVRWKGGFEVAFYSAEGEESDLDVFLLEC